MSVDSLQDGAAQAKLFVDDGGVVEDEGLGTLGRAVVVYQADGRDAGHAFGKLLGVGYGGGGEDELGTRAVEVADAQEAAEDVRHVRAEDAPVVMHLVYDDVAQVLEEADPLGVVGENAGVQHIGVGDDDVPGGAHQLAGGGRGVAIVGEGLDVALKGGRRWRVGWQVGPGRGPSWGRGRAPAPPGPPGWC